jgi:hypothetical protein
MKETRAVAMDTDRGELLFSACRECSDARTNARVSHFRDGPLKATHSGLNIYMSITADLCRAERLSPAKRGFFCLWGATTHMTALNLLPGTGRWIGELYRRRLESAQALAV